MKMDLKKKKVRISGKLERKLMQAGCRVETGNRVGQGGDEKGEFN